jgi:hypothetical protein
MTKKYSSYKDHQLITENWRKFLAEEEAVDIGSPEVVELAAKLLRQKLPSTKEPSAVKEDSPGTLKSIANPDHVVTQKVEPVSVPTKKDLGTILADLVKGGVNAVGATATAAGAVAGAFKWIEFFATNRTHTGELTQLHDAVVALITSPLGAAMGGVAPFLVWSAATIAVAEALTLLGLQPPDDGPRGGRGPDGQPLPTWQDRYRAAHPDRYRWNRGE